MPKALELRQRRNKASTRAMLPPETTPRKRAPSLPDHPEGAEEVWHPMAVRWWKEIWHSPMSVEILRADEMALCVLLILVDKYFRFPSVQLAAEIRQQQKEFGLTPLNRRRLEWQVAQAEEAKDRYEHKRVRRAVILDAGDPRKSLE